MRPYSSYSGPSSAPQPRERPSEAYLSGSNRSSFPRRRSPDRGGPSEHARPRDIPPRSAGGSAGRSYPPSGGRTSRWGPELPYSSSSSSSSSFGGTSSSPTKGGRGWRAMQEAGPRRRQDDRRGNRREADEVDWAEVEARAREKGFAVPGDIVDEFKRQGHFDHLRRQLLSSLLASPQKEEFLASISSLLLSHFQADPEEAIRISAMDPRVRPDEFLKIIESDEPPRRRNGDRGGPAPMTGPQIIGQLMKKLVTEAGAGAAQGEDAKVDRADNDVSGILTSEGLIGRGVKERVEMLLREEVREKGKIVAPVSPAPPVAGENTVKGEGSVIQEGVHAAQNQGDADASQDQDGQGNPREETESEVEPDRRRSEEEEDVPMETD